MQHRPGSNRAPGGERRKLLHMDRASASTVTRLSSYYRALGELGKEGMDTVSSDRLAERAGLTSAQVRKDLSFFGNFGRRGLGYNVAKLRRKLGEILGLTQRWRVALLGAGNLGHALFAYKAFQKQGFVIEAVFDVDPRKVGQKWEGIGIRSIAELQQVAAKTPFDIAIIAVPERAAQAVAEAAVAAGIRGILNFAPVKLTISPQVALRDVDLSIAMESLSYALVKLLP
ncbi:MAG TPA: redox-sensing transcriptional repressor Rex [Candidatus Krumholzibacteria bacterium]|nr:redox-sensing transcriptional repressor Rex [Candidatus Krumholzibacteria bacterium]